MTQHFKIALPDGSVREVAPGTTPADVAAAIGPGLAKAALAARVNGELRDLGRPFEDDAQLAWSPRATRRTRWSWCATISRMCWPRRSRICSRYPDHLRPRHRGRLLLRFRPRAGRGPFTEEDLPLIEAEMRRIIARDEPLVREVWTRDQLIAHFREHGETFKAEWAAEKPGDETLTVYRSGDWLDMCRGPHLASTGKLDPQAFKLTRVSGAYWRGDQKNAMLSRIYGTAWLNKKQLDAHLHRLEEAAKRDHRKIGREMDLFHLQEEAHGSIFWHPKGYLIWRALEAYLRRRLDAADYREVKTPQLMDARSGRRAATGASIARTCSWCRTRRRTRRMRGRSSRARPT
jgi:threonyl-tRNA synthetase